MTSIIKPETLQFLKNVRKNNNRDWFQKNKPDYESAKSNVESFRDYLVQLMQNHDQLERAKLFRIYRDVRFSKDKSPYKTSFGTGFRRATEKLRGGYYLHIEPGNTYVAGGFFNPKSPDLMRIRKAISTDPSRIEHLLKQKTFIEMFGSLRGEEVKTAPKGFSKDDPAIELIRKKQFTVRRNFDLEYIINEDFGMEIDRTFKAMRPFFDYMSEVLV